MPEHERINLNEVIKSGPMLKELSRWSKPAPVAQSTRWSDWARSLAGRHSQVSRRAGGAAMTFARQAAITQLQNSYRMSLSIRPTIKLAIQPLLAEMVLRGERVRVEQQGADLFRATHATQARTTAENSIDSSATVRLESQVSNAGPFDEAVLPRGLSLVFRRLRHFDEFTRARMESNTIHESVERLSLRIVERSRRIEQHAATSPAVVRQAVAQKSEQGAAAGAANEFAASRIPPMLKDQAQSWPARPVEIPDAMIEQVTERVIRQIDDRATAWRERMGKF
ncbi:MAG TPA: hypothetical protein VJZ26_02555 [Blastocatellia bacterium]|nr:hypothetical protein [Blastocatellia bacterium]